MTSTLPVLAIVVPSLKYTHMCSYGILYISRSRHNPANQSNCRHDFDVNTKLWLLLAQLLCNKSVVRLHQILHHDGCRSRTARISMHPQRMCMHAALHVTQQVKLLNYLKTGMQATIALLWAWGLLATAALLFLLGMLQQVNGKLTFLAS